MNIKNEIDKAVSVLKAGGTILYPTDTIWGIGCDATNQAAVKKIFEIKQRQDTRSMLVLLDNEVKLQTYVKEVPEIAWELIDVSENPLTIIDPDAKNLASNLINEDKSIGIRIVNDEFCSHLIRKFKKPIVSTSANISGKPSPENFHSIEDEIKNAVDLIVNHSKNDLRKRKPSSIIKVGVNSEIKILRQ